MQIVPIFCHIPCWGWGRKLLLIATWFGRALHLLWKIGQRKDITSQTEMILLRQSPYDRANSYLRLLPAYSVPVPVLATSAAYRDMNSATKDRLLVSSLILNGIFLGIGIIFLLRLLKRKVSTSNYQLYSLHSKLTMYTLKQCTLYTQQSLNNE